MWTRNNVNSVYTPLFQIKLFSYLRILCLRFCILKLVLFIMTVGKDLNTHKMFKRQPHGLQLEKV
jgi:hypothetical protein